MVYGARNCTTSVFVSTTQCDVAELCLLGRPHSDGVIKYMNPASSSYALQQRFNLGIVFSCNLSRYRHM